MRVSAVSLNGVNIYRSYPSNRREFEESLLPYNFGKIPSLRGMPYVYPISFTSIQNSSKLRKLFEYGLPCMYSGVEMIDPKVLSRMIKNQIFFRRSDQVLGILKKYKNSITGMEANVLSIIDQRSKIKPHKTIKELLVEVEPVYRKKLYKKQAPIFHELKSEFLKLPIEYQEKFEVLMQNTEKRLYKQPIHVPFSSYEFKYKLAKIKDDVIQGDNLKSKKVINKLLKESKRLYAETNESTIDNQKRVVGLMDWILRKSVLRNNPQLKDLIEVSKARLANKETVIPFARKSFIYDLAKIIEPLEDKIFQEKLINIAQKLPTSNQDLSAYILKCATEPSDKIGYRLLWPSLASVEHIHPRSCGGLDIMANFGGATTRENSYRKSIDFTEQLKLRPNTPLYCQKYVDRLIELYHKGVFAKNKINPKYIEDFRNTILRESKGLVDVDISKMYVKPLQD